MNAEKLLGAEATVALAGVVTSDLVGQTGAKALPKPRRILAVFLFYGSLSLISSLGAGPARFAAASGGLVAVASLVLGTTGRTIVDLLNRGSGLLSSPGADAGTGSSSQPGVGSPSNPNPKGSPGNAPPGFHYAQGAGGKWFLIPNNPNAYPGAITPSSGRVRSTPSTVGALT